jgi:hypothetical protein
MVLRIRIRYRRLPDLTKVRDLPPKEDQDHIGKVRYLGAAVARIDKLRGLSVNTQAATISIQFELCG